MHTTRSMLANNMYILTFQAELDEVLWIVKAQHPLQFPTVWHIMHEKNYFEGYL